MQYRKFWPSPAAPGRAPTTRSWCAVAARPGPGPARRRGDARSTCATSRCRSTTAISKHAGLPRTPDASSHLLSTHHAGLLIASPSTTARSRRCSRTRSTGSRARRRRGRSSCHSAARSRACWRLAGRARRPARAWSVVRSILGNIGVLVVPRSGRRWSKAHEAFIPDGTLANPKQHAAVEALGVELAKILLKLACQALIPEQAERRHDLTRIR